MTAAFTPGDTFIPASDQVIGEREKELIHKAMYKIGGRSQPWPRSTIKILK